MTTPWDWVLAGLSIPLIILALIAYANEQWLFTPLPPIPTNTSNVQTYTGSMAWWQRTTEFETDLSAEAIQQYYQTELPKRGWQYLHTIQYNPPSVPFYEHYDLIDEYVLDTLGAWNHRTLMISIWLQGAWTDVGKNRRVVITECGRPGFPCNDRDKPE